MMKFSHANRTAPRLAALAALMALSSCGVKQAVSAPTLFPAAPPMSWEEQQESAAWTEAALSALSSEGVTLMSSMPADVLEYCPNYAKQTQPQRAAFWAGFVSAMARQESGLNPLASGGNGLRMGLMGISPKSAKSSGCEGSLLDAKANVTCAVRILAREVARDGAIHSAAQGAPALVEPHAASEAKGGEKSGRGITINAGRWFGVAREFVSLRSAGGRSAIANFTRRQSYCR